MNVMDAHSGGDLVLYIIWLWPEGCLRGWSGVAYAPTTHHPPPHPTPPLPSPVGLAFSGYCSFFWQGI